MFKRLMGEVEKWTLVLMMAHLSTLFYRPILCPGGIFIIINLIDIIIAFPCYMYLCIIIFFIR